eukprot:Rmarinus@m.5913
MGLSGGPSSLGPKTLLQTQGSMGSTTMLMKQISPDASCKESGPIDFTASGMHVTIDLQNAAATKIQAIYRGHSTRRSGGVGEFNKLNCSLRGTSPDAETSLDSNQIPVSSVGLVQETTCVSEGFFSSAGEGILKSGVGIEDSCKDLEAIVANTEDTHTVSTKSHTIYHGSQTRRQLQQQPATGEALGDELAELSSAPGANEAAVKIQ